jgi:hypothetical protein
MTLSKYPYVVLTNCAATFYAVDAQRAVAPERSAPHQEGRRRRRISKWNELLFQTDTNCQGKRRILPATTQSGFTDRD